MSPQENVMPGLCTQRILGAHEKKKRHNFCHTTTSARAGFFSSHRMNQPQDRPFIVSVREKQTARGQMY